MFALLILPILISGFVVLSLSPKEKLLLHRYDGQLLYLKAAKKGLQYFLVTVGFCIFFKEPRTFELCKLAFTTPDIPITTVVAKFILKATNSNTLDSDTLETSWLLTISLLTVVLAYVIQIGKVILLKIQNMIANRQFKQTNDIQRIAILGKFFKDSPIDFMFYESFKKRKAILVTLKSRKVYVGMVNKLGEPNESKEPNQEISVVTALSGYRDKDSLKVVFTNNYDATDKDQSIHILRLEQIDSVCWYHGSTFDAVNGNMQSETPSTTVDSEQETRHVTVNTIDTCQTCKDKIKARLGSLYLLKN